MPAGSVETVNFSAQKYNKSTSAQIGLGKVAILDTSLTPDGWKQADAAGANGPFVVAVNDLAATTDTYFTGATAPATVLVEAGGALEPGAIVKVDAAGDVVAATVGTDAEVKFVGKYLTKEGESDASAAADGDIVRIKLGGGSV